MAARRLYMSSGGFTSELPVNADGDYFTGEQLIGVSGAVAKQGTVSGEIFAGFVSETQRGLKAGFPIKLVRPMYVMLPLPGVQMTDLWALVYSAEDAVTITLDSVAAGATLMGRIYQVDLDRGQVLVDLAAAARAGGAPAGAYVRYFGWSATGVVTSATFPSAAEARSNVGTLPAQTDNSHVWFAVPQSAGWPVELLIGDFAQIGTPYNRQAGTVTYNGVEYLVGVTVLAQTDTFGGQRVALEY